MAEAMWYVVHTYSGYENKVKMDIEKTIENRKLHDQILEVSVPMQDVVELKNGVRKTVAKKMFPGYVLINMEMNDETWYVVRNTRGVTGFVGPGSKPVPLSPEEIASLAGPEAPVVVDFEIGDAVNVISGVWEGTAGVIAAINESKQSVTIHVDMFGRDPNQKLSASLLSTKSESEVTSVGVLNLLNVLCCNLTVLLSWNIRQFFLYHLVADFLGFLTGVIHQILR